MKQFKLLFLTTTLIFSSLLFSADRETGDSASANSKAELEVLEGLFRCLQFVAAKELLKTARALKNLETHDSDTWLNVKTAVEGLIIEILSDKKLTRRIPGELGQLSDLRRLSLSDNKLTGPIPGELGRLTKLTYLDLSNKQLTGPIPGELGRLTKLTYLDLSKNQLTGQIPVELGQLAALVQFSFSCNNLRESLLHNMSNRFYHRNNEDDIKLFIKLVSIICVIKLLVGGFF